MLARLSLAQALFDADGAYAIAADGTIVGHATQRKSSTGTNVAFRPYFKRAMAGVANVYAAVGSVSDERGMYYASPVHIDGGLASPVIGVVMVKMSSDKVDQLLRFAGGESLLISPQGVVFSSTRADWLLTMTPPMSAQRAIEIRKLKRFGSRFEADAPPVLGFDPALDQVRVDGREYLVLRKNVEWSDPSGPWQVVSLHNTDQLVSRLDWLRTGAPVFTVAGAIGFLLLQVLAGRRRVAAARARYNTLGTALEVSPMSVVIANRDGRIDWVNPQFERDTGYALPELVGRHVGFILNSKTPKQDFNDLARIVLSGKPWRGELFNQRKDGTHFFGHTLVAPIFDSQGNVQGFVALQEDTTHERQLQRQLAEQIAFQNVLVDTIPVPLFYKGPDARFLGFNRAFEDAFNLKRETLIGKHLMEVNAVSELDRAHYRREDERVIREASSVRRQLVMPYADGQQHSTLYWVQGFRRQDGSPGGLVGTFVNMSEQERAQAQLRQAKELADAASRAKGDFLANMSHEIRTPMNAIIGMAYLVRKTRLTAQQADYVEKIQQSGQNLLGLINDILDVSKVEAGKLAIEHIEFDLNRVIHNVINMVGDKALAKGLALDADIAADVPASLVGDPLRLGQVLINFANNAVKFTQSGAIRIKVRVAEKFGDGLLLVFEVVDTGIGVSPEQAQRLFQSFEQADASTTRQYGGTGLGLAISKGLATLMGGSVGMESSEGQGATFWFTARVGLGAGSALVRHDSLDAPSSAQALLQTLSGARVLLVEDNALNQQVATELLKSAGMQVDLAQNGRMAVDKVAVSNAAGLAYDLVLMDLQMPVMDGIEATLEIRADPRNAGLPIAAMTANAMLEDRHRCTRAGMNGFVAKPVEPDELWQTLAQLIRPREGLGQALKPSTDAANQDPQNDMVNSQLLLLAQVPGLDTRLGLRRVMGRKPLYLALLRKFVATQAGAVDEVALALDEDDWRRAERVAHTLKGVAGNIGANQLEMAAKTLESAIPARAPRETLDQSLLAVRQLLDALVGQLKDKLPDDLPGVAVGGHEAGDVLAVCNRLAELLEQQDFEATELFARNLDMLALALGPGLDGLSAAIDGFKFEVALAALRSACQDNQIPVHQKL